MHPMVYSAGAAFFEFGCLKEEIIIVERALDKLSNYFLLKYNKSVSEAIFA